MAELSFPLENTTYTAEEAAIWFATRGSGVYANNHLAVSAGSGMAISVGEGMAWLAYARYAGVAYLNDAAKTLMIGPADARNDRIDRVVIRYSRTANSVQMAVLAGAASASPVAPALTRTDETYEISLAQIYVRAGSTSITAGSITDERLNESVCGLMRDSVNSIPTDDLFQKTYDAIRDDVVKALLDSAIASSAVLPDYWMQHVNVRIPQIREALSSAGWNKSAFFFYTDAHWTNNYKSSPELLRYLSDHTPIRKTFFGGDIVSAEGDAGTETMDYLWSWRDRIRHIPNHHSVPGNHDDGNTIDNRFDDPYIYSWLLAAEETPDIRRGSSGLYYYVDDHAEKTRYLFLDTATKDGNIWNDDVQKAWLTETLLSVPENWHVVATAHIWRVYNSNYEDDGFGMGAKYCLDQFDAYNARTGDYWDGKGKVEFCIGGHTHWDADRFSDGGIPVIISACDCIPRDGTTCVKGTKTESAVNAIVADYDNGFVNVIRIGRGSSRRVFFDGRDSEILPDDDTDAGGGTLPDQPEGNYNNVLNSVGYKENMRYSTSSASDVAATGWDLTGYIPCTVGQVIRFKNVTWYPSTENEERGSLYWYKADKTLLSNKNITTTDSLVNWIPKYDSNNNIVEITVPSGVTSSMAYLRICCQDINADSIITVDEEIA